MARFFEVAELAATAIQRCHRGQPSPLTEGKTLLGGSRQSLHHWCMSCPVSAGEKYDGTNLGKLHGGTLLGRRLVIEPTATTYQRCSLNDLRTLDTDAALDDLVTMVGAAWPQRAAVYGELVCNSGLYHYQASGLAKSWQAFGALLEFESAEAAATYAKAASASSGLVCGVSDDCVVRVCNNELFGKMLRQHRVPAVPTTTFGSLCEAVASQRAWMTEERGEGLVISLQKARDKASTYKWKISREPQPSAVTELAELLEALANGAGGKAVLVDRSIHGMIGHLHAVATHVDSTALASAAAKPQMPQKAAKQSKQSAVDKAVVEQAIASALTKFDALETTFEAEGKQSLNKLTERLCTEVLSDADLALPTGGDSKEAAVREVNSSVKRHLGQAYGTWLKGQQGAR